MLRFPNPGSDIDSYIRIFYEIFEALNNKEYFDLDDMIQVLVERNLATSSGYTGQQAFARSVRDDRSRDPLYNQSKMYSEIYKILGWLHPSEEKALRFRFTFLGAHAANASKDIRALFRECILGVAYPNPILSVSGTYQLRPFVTILRTAAELDGYIYRDEMIVGPMCLSDDRNQTEFSNMIGKLKAIRGNWDALDQEFEQMTQERKISQNTAKNYTRFPIGVLTWTGWMEKERVSDIYGKSLVFLKLTQSGKKILRNYDSQSDLRGMDTRNWQTTHLDAVSRIHVYQMLERAGFDISPIQSELQHDVSALSSAGLNNYTQGYFSPFQELDPSYINQLLPFSPSTATSTTIASEQPQIPEETSIVDLLTHVSYSSNHDIVKRSAEADVEALLDEASSHSPNTDDMIEFIAQKYLNSDQRDFYPLVASLFRAIGYDCEHSRAGVNHYRFDAMIEHTEQSVPIEIKSPTEELHLSVKAVRQALENKIILLSRSPHKTLFDTTSLAVGYNIPNDRSEVQSLIRDIYKTYGISIGVIDIRSLIHIVILELRHNRKHNAGELLKLRGIIDVTNT